MCLAARDEIDVTANVYLPDLVDEELCVGSGSLPQVLLLPPPTEPTSRHTIADKQLGN